MVWGTEGALPADAFRAYPGAHIGVEVGPAINPAAYADGDAFAEACWAKVEGMAVEKGVDLAGDPRSDNDGDGV